jgi:ComF family protein
MIKDRGAVVNRGVTLLRQALGGLRLAQDCILCGAAAGSEILCAPCESALPRLHGALCSQCALPLPTGGVCGACQRRPPSFYQTLAALEYAFPVDSMIHAFKYAGNLALAPHLAGHLMDALRAHRRPDVVVPVPLSRVRLRERGFNQSLEIARLVARRLALPLLPSLLVRVRDTQPQTNLPWRARSANVKGAFACSTDLQGKHCAIVDDVMTTGATLDEAASVLKRRGAESVSVWVVARTLPERRLERAGKLV